MSNTKQKRTPSFKAKIALASISGPESIADLARKFSLNPTQIYQWKTILLENAHKAFESGETSSDDRDLLLQKIGELTLERDFLANASRR